MVQHLGAVNLRLEYESLRVHQQVALTPFDLLAPVVSALFSAHRGALDRLGVHHASAGLRVPFQSNAQAFAEGLVDPLPATVDAPFPEVVVDGGPPGEVVGEQAPLATALKDVEDGVEDLSRRSWILGRPCPLGAGRWGCM